MVNQILPPAKLNLNTITINKIRDNFYGLISIPFVSNQIETKQKMEKQLNWRLKYYSIHLLIYLI
jgi:hypothetical protein